MDTTLQLRVQRLEDQLRQVLQPVSKPRLIVGSGATSGTKIVLTPGGGIAAVSGATVSNADCTEYSIVSGTLTTNTVTVNVKNIWPFAIPGSMYIIAAQESIGLEWIAIHPGIVDVQWTSPDLEQTLDGSTYTNIDTAEVCT